MPKAMPELIAISMAASSSAEPWADLNLIRLNVPPMAMPAPMDPDTKVITVAMAKGIIAVTRKNLLVDLTLKDMSHENTRPAIRETPAIMKNDCAVSVEVYIVLNIVLPIPFCILNPCYAALPRPDLCGSGAAPVKFRGFLVIILL